MTFAVPSDLATNDVFPEAWADQVRDNFTAMSTWSSWTPTVTQSGTVTKTVTVARYIRLADLVIMQWYLTMTGSGTTNNTITITLPVTADAASAVMIGSGAVDDNGTATYPCLPTIASTTTLKFLRSDTTTNSSFIGVDPNFALASGDLIRGSGIYRAA